MNVRDGTFRVEWQCVRYVQGRVAVRLTLPLGVGRAGQRAVHCHSASSVPHRYDQGRVAVRLTLPLGGERTGRHVQGRVAVPPSLPLGIERTALVRSGSSGSATGTFGGEWQCDSHCHSVVSVLGSAALTATRHRAYRIGTIRGEWQCVRYAQGRVAVLAGRDGLRTRSRYADWRVAQLGKCARATACQAAGAVAPEPVGLGLGPDHTERRSLDRGPR